MPIPDFWPENQYQPIADTWKKSGFIALLELNESAKDEILFYT